MKKMHYTVLVMIIIIIIIGTIQTNKSYATDDNGNFVVVLDPGHGGNDPGASGGGLVEAQINYKIAKFAKQELEKYEGVKVYLTRYNNCPKLAERVEIAKNYNADLLVSMHINSGSTKSKGAAIWVTRDNSKIEYYDKAKEVGENILSKISTLGIFNNGVQTRVSNDDRWYDSGVKQDYYGIIRNAQLIKLRSILIEHCFISNGADREYINTDDKIKQLAIKDVQGIAESYDLHKKGEGYKPVKSISLEILKLVLESTEENKEPIYYFNTTFNPISSTNKNLQWYSSDPSTVRVYNGKIRGLKPGSAIITAISSSNQRIAKCEVKVTKPKVALNSLSFEKEKVQIGINEKSNLKLIFNPSNCDEKEVEWSSSNPEVVRIWYGDFRGLKEGTSVITVTSKVSGKTAKCTIKVTNKDRVPVQDIKLEKSEFTVNENEALDLPYTYSPTNSTNAKFIWKSSNPEILRVYNNRFRGLKQGIAYVIVTTEDRKF